MYDNNYVRPKKALGQHFLTDENIAQSIANSLNDISNCVLEIGPGTGVLTKHLLNIYDNYFVIEIDEESIRYLSEHYPALNNKIISGDFLKLDLNTFNSFPLAIIGNFPYNISSQILFKVFENIELCNQLVGMFQKEVAVRICSKEGNKNYGILSVLIQAFYDVEYLFAVPPTVFNPPPKVESAVIRLTRNSFFMDAEQRKLLKILVKTAFNQRRKMLSNALKPLPKGDISNIDKDILKLRAEQLTVQQFIEMSKNIFV
ncbi:MAG: hypothetical protein A2X12_08200 [Bacteroidetes bacterium GWE2_29_8]|nr:MAG: hypothetical protein A2X12_08200 [Bacteroidetes bacterium GWE2_29_8]OFY15653.1 MAG: hypothetical protein A2X02_06465 [Bacteroidetes bacterium GWF2_29_10]